MILLCPQGSHARRRSWIIHAGRLILTLLMLVSPLTAQQTGDAIPSLTFHAAVWGLEFSPDGKWLAAATNVRDHGGPIVIWSVTDWNRQLVRQEATGGVDIAFSADSRQLAYTTRDGRVVVIQPPTGELIRDIQAHEKTAMGVAFLPNGKQLLSCGNDGTIKSWDLASGRLVRSLDGPDRGVNGIAISPDGNLLVSGGYRDTRVWDLESGQVSQFLEAGQSLTRRVDFSRDGSFLVTCNWSGNTGIRDVGTWHLRSQIAGSSDGAALTSDNRLLATTGRDTTAAVYRTDLQPASETQRQQILRLISQLDVEDYDHREAASEAIIQLGMLAEPFLYEARNSASAEVRMRSRKLRQRILSPPPIAELSGHSGDVEVVYFSPDDRLLATGCRGGDIKIWSVPEFQELRTLHAPDRP